MPNRVGRPPTAGITDALIVAAERTMSERGFSALTVDGLVSEVGTTRPTFYRRFPSVAHLALEVLKTRFGAGQAFDTGTIAGDFLAMQQEEIEMLAHPVMRNSIVGMLEAARAHPDLLPRYGAEFIAPRRGQVTVAIARAIERGELSGSAVDEEYVCDVLLGPVLARVLLPLGSPVDDTLVHQTAASALAALGLHDAARLVAEAAPVVSSADPAS